MCDHGKKGEPDTSVSSGTMRERDLIPAFIEALRTLGCQDIDVDDIENRVDAGGDKYFDSEEASLDLNETLFELLNEHAPEGCYFGAHPGDGCDYGFWTEEDSDTGEGDA